MSRRCIEAGGSWGGIAAVSLPLSRMWEKPTAEETPSNRGEDTAPTEQRLRKRCFRRPAAKACAAGIPLPALLACAIVLLALAGCAGNPPRVGTGGGMAAAPVDASVQRAFDQAVALLRQEQYSQAVDVLSPVAQAHPELPGPLVNLAVAYIHLGRQEQAMAALQQALAAEPAHPAALNWLAILQRRAGRFEEAKSLYQQLLAAHPESRHGHLNLGILCDLYLQQADCALRHYRRYLELAGEDAEVGRWIADLERRRQG
mgnify:CR=1 FL=1